MAAATTPYDPSLPLTDGRIAGQIRPPLASQIRSPLALGVLLFEVLLIAGGLWLRLRFDRGHDASWGYDSSSHWAYMHWIAARHELPPIKAFRAAYHPPVYYWLCGMAMRLGAQTEVLRKASAITGTLKLCLLAWGMRRHLPSWPGARLVAVALAAVLPCAVHVDCMLTNESLEGLLSIGAMLLTLELFRSSTQRRWRLAPWLGLVLAAALLTKVSALVIIASVGLGLAVEILFVDGNGAPTLARAAPGAVALLIAMALALPIQARHYKTTGRLFPTGYESGTKTLPKEVQTALKLPYLKRRAPAYVLGLGTTQILREPYYPTDISPDSRFWPVLFASTFSDYYNYHFAGVAKVGEPTIMASERAMPAAAVPYVRSSVMGGLVIAVTTLVGLTCAILVSLRRRDLAMLVILAIPILAVLGQLHFAITFPVDKTGPVKGAYTQFAAPPLFAVFGIAVEWLGRRAWRWPALLVLAGAMAGVTAYTIYGVTR